MTRGGVGEGEGRKGIGMMELWTVEGGPSSSTPSCPRDIQVFPSYKNL